MLPATKEQPKEMLPVFSGHHDQECLKPLVQLVYEQLFDFGLREFCFIVGRGKRVVEDHFVEDYGYVRILTNRERTAAARELLGFYDRLRESTIVWINQPEPKGFGDAVLRARPFVGDEAFLVHAGDTHISSENQELLKRLLASHQRLGADASIVVQEVEDPKQYGIVDLDECGIDEFRVKKAVEKPEKPFSKFAIMPIYVFSPIIFEALAEASPGKDGELQLTDGIQILVNRGAGVYAVKMRETEIRLDIGTPQTYWHALRQSWEYMRSKS